MIDPISIVNAAIILANGINIQITNNNINQIGHFIISSLEECGEYSQNNLEVKYETMIIINDIINNIKYSFVIIIKRPIKN